MINHVKYNLKSIRHTLDSKNFSCIVVTIFVTSFQHRSFSLAIFIHVSFHIFTFFVTIFNVLFLLTISKEFSLFRLVL
jgi:hypothetical protein